MGSKRKGGNKKLKQPRREEEEAAPAVVLLPPQQMTPQLQQGSSRLARLSSNTSAATTTDGGSRRQLVQSRPSGGDTTTTATNINSGSVPRQSVERGVRRHSHSNDSSNDDDEWANSQPRESWLLTTPAVQRLDKRDADAVLAALTRGRMPRGSGGGDGPDAFVAVPKGTIQHRPSTSKTARKQQRQQQASTATTGGANARPRSLLAWLRQAILSWEDFASFPSGSTDTAVAPAPSSPSPSMSNSSLADIAERNSNSSRDVRRWQVGAAKRLDAVEWLPDWAKRATFYTIDFFTHKRVYIAASAVLVAMLCTAAGPTTKDAFTAVSDTFIVDEDSRPGLTFLEKYNEGSRELPNKHPVVIVPGFITGALELWEAKGTCLERQSALFASTFRQRMFGPQMLMLMLSDPACWLELFGADKTTGVDKPGVKVRADTGFTSVDFFVPGYWVWAKVLINLADIGYDPQSMAVMTYDWRLSPSLTHDRDGFYFAVRSNIKFLCQKNRQRAVVISHSYGTTIALAFFRWSERREPGFMNRYVAYYVNVGGTTFGVPKAVSALLQGDVKDTLMIPAPARRVFDTFISQSLRYEFTRSWSSIYAMVPHGCEEAATDVLTFSDGSAVTMAGLYDLIINECLRTNHTHCAEEMSEMRAEADDLPVLPQAPDTAVVCLYGVNKQVEVGYRLEDMGPHSSDNNSCDSEESEGDDDDEDKAGHHHHDDDNEDEESHRYPHSNKKKKNNRSRYDDDGNGAEGDASCGWPAGTGAESIVRTNLSHTDGDTVQGVRIGNGDGTVPLGSLGFMCRAPNGWRQNVGRVVTVEFPHEAAKASPLNLRGGTGSADHVDILGNFEFLETILKLASGIDDLGAEEGMDEVTWPEEELETSEAYKKLHKKRKGNGRDRRKNKERRKGRKFVTLHRRVYDRVVSNIDEYIVANMSTCLARPNVRIRPKDSKEDSTYL